MVCWNCRGDHPVNSCEMPPRNKAVTKIFVDRCIVSMCFDCCSLGHLARFCHRLNPADRRRCQRCKRIGHPEWRCPMPVDFVVRGPFWTVYNLDDYDQLEIEERRRRLSLLFESGEESPFDVRIIWGTPHVTLPETLPALGPIIERITPGEVPHLPIGGDDEWMDQVDLMVVAEINRRSQREPEAEANMDEEDVIVIEPEAPELIVISDSEEEAEGAVGGCDPDSVSTWEIPVEGMVSAMVQVMIDTIDLTPNEVVAYGRRLAPNLQQACLEMLRLAKEIAEKHCRLEQ